MNLFVLRKHVVNVKHFDFCQKKWLIEAKGFSCLLKVLAMSRELNLTEVNLIQVHKVEVLCTMFPLGFVQWNQEHLHSMIA